MRGAWPSLFGGTRDNIPPVIALPCCSQFAVYRFQTLKRSKKEYLHYRQWFLDASDDDAVGSRVFEYLWHIAFGKDPVYFLILQTVIKTSPAAEQVVPCKSPAM